MKLDEFATRAQEAVTARRVFTEPTERDGVTIVGAANVSGGGGGGQGHDKQGQEGEGGGFGLNARPAGAYVLKDGNVRWMPAIDVNRALATLGAVLIVYLITRARVAKVRARAAIGNS